MIETLREILLENPPFYIALGGAVIGFIFGFIVLATNFCTMGSISDFMTFGDFRRFRSWLLASATAIIGAQWLGYIGAVDLNKSMYLSANLNWFGSIAGGFIFGIGMVLAGGCASRNLARAGAGDLRSLIVILVVGLFAYMTISGIFAPTRAYLDQATSISLSAAGTQSMGAILSSGLGLNPETAGWLVLLFVAGALLIYCFASAAFRSSGVHIIAGLGIGLCVVAGWALTGLAYDEFAARPTPPGSLSFVRPAGDTMEFLARSTAYEVPPFAVMFVIGGLAGSFAAALLTGKLRLSGFTGPADTARNLLGAAMMGVGGVMALGCTIGQAITGFSTLAAGSVLAFAAIVTGGIVGVKLMERMLDV